MTCANCQPWVAKNWKMYRIRQDNMRAAPHVLPHACKVCGGTDWATLAPDGPDDDSTILNKSELVVIGAVLAAIVIIVLVLTRHVRAEPLTFRNDKGQVTGYGDRRGNSTTLSNDKGQQTGRAERRGNTTTIYDDKGREVGTVQGSKR